MSSIKPVILVILDGWGIAPAGPGNAITLAKTPNFSRLETVYPHAQLEASGQAVGLLPSEDGNSEAGHLNIGGGGVIYQDLPRISMTIAEGEFFKIPAFLMAAEHVANHQSTLHLMGLISDAGVHSSLSHLFALLRLVKEKGVKKLLLHLFTDGRDSPPTSSLSYISQIKEELKKIEIGQIATLIGRYYAMDRDHRWERTKKAYDLLVLGKGKKFSSEEEAVNQSYQEGKTDEFLEPVVLVNENGQPRGLIEDNDTVIFYNFRIDRPRQLTKAFVLPNFETLKAKKEVGFDPYGEKYGLKAFEQPTTATTTFNREKVLKGVFFVTMTQYERNLPVEVGFDPIFVQMPLGRILAEAGIRQVHIAETEKFPHVTYFFNGGREKRFPGEDQILIQSPRDVPTYDLKPEMSIQKVTEEAVKKIHSRTYKFVLINFANPDMVAHTGVLEAGIKACEATDESLGKIVRAAAATDTTVLITADHGNVEEMINLKTGEADTEHSSNPVPFIVVDKKYTRGGWSLPNGILGDIAPTILGIMNIPKPSTMSGRNLLKNF